MKYQIETSKKFKKQLKKIIFQKFKSCIGNNRKVGKRRNFGTKNLTTINLKEILSNTENDI